MSELLFECYSAPSVVYAVDSLAAFHTSGQQDGLVVSSSTAATHIIPVLDGRGILANTKRLNYGGQTAIDYLLKLVQLKFPNFPVRVTASQAEVRSLRVPLPRARSPSFAQDMYHDHGYLSLDYPAEIAALADPDRIVAMDRIVQFPFSSAVAEEKTAEQLEQQLERRREAGRRLQEQQAQARLEKVCAVSLSSQRRSTALSSTKKSKTLAPGSS
jgi:actin-related protein 5